MGAEQRLVSARKLDYSNMVIRHSVSLSASPCCRKQTLIKRMLRPHFSRNSRERLRLKVALTAIAALMAVVSRAVEKSCHKLGRRGRMDAIALIRLQGATSFCCHSFAISEVSGTGSKKPASLGGNWT